MRRPARMRRLAWLLLLAAMVGCRSDARSGGERGQPSAATQAPQSVRAAGSSKIRPCPELPDAPTVVDAPARVVAIGDIHGDIAGLRRVLRLAGAIDDADRWAGGELVVVQTGDILDRGDNERAIIDWLERLREQAREAGGDMLLLNGNHELMNAALDFRYVTPGGYAEFADVPAAPEHGAGSLPADIPAPARGRIHALRPGGEYARRLAAGNIVQIVGDTVFAHGGVTSGYADRATLDRLNRALRCWLADPQARPDAMPAPGRDPDGPVWTRRFSLEPADCDGLTRALDGLGVQRMVVGHTVQNAGITAACDERVWRIDTGIAEHYGGPRQALEIRGDAVRVLQ